MQLEALKRLEGVDLESNPALKAAVLKIVNTTRGTPQFVELVRQFKLTGQNAALLEVALRHPGDASGVAAMRMILDSGDLEDVRSALEPSGTDAPACAQALGNTRLAVVNDLLSPLLADDTASDVLRRESVKALAKNEAGAVLLLQHARNGTLPDSVQLTAATALSQVSWAGLRDEAARLLPLPKAGGDEELPPIAELARRRGNASNGRIVYYRGTTACHRCHIVNGEGVGIGPDLSEIGDKLGRDALIEAIIDPNNGIAFGYEAWTVVTRDGGEIFGLVASETADELAVKDLSGIVHRLEKSKIESRVRSDFSLMPAGLQTTMTTGELVDLIEFLAGLKKSVR